MRRRHGRRWRRTSDGEESESEGVCPDPSDGEMSTHERRSREERAGAREDGSEMERSVSEVMMVT